MLKIFLVEDEFVVREGIKNNIDWQAHGYEFCGEASDGELALPQIRKQQPDIVITDIRMPFMDGLELSRLIKKEFPWMEIIILTGFGEFQYAKEGIQIGVARYLLKPINSEELVREIDSLADKIMQSRQEREIHEKYAKEMEENSLKEKRELFQDIVTGEKTPAQLIEKADRLSIDLSAGWYNIVLIKIKSIHHEQSEYSDSLVEIEEKLNRVAAREGLLIFDRNLEGYALVFKADTKEEIEQMQKEVLGSILVTLEGYRHVRYFGGIGMPVNRLRELPFSFEKASHAFAHRYLVSDSRILDSRDLEQSGYVQTEGFDMKNIDTKQIGREKIREFLKIGEKEETIYFVEEFFKNVGRTAMQSSLFRQYITLDAYFCVAEFMESLGLPREELETADRNPETLQSVDGAMQYTIRIIEKAIEMRELNASNRYGDVVEEVLTYIEENYAQEDLSLNVIASHVNFSPNHLSAVFSQQSGQTLIKYLTDFRMNKAKELLRCTSKRSSVISLEVGYKDPHYFSYLFKKTQGMTPTQYRGGKNPEGDEKDERKMENNL